MNGVGWFVTGVVTLPALYGMVYAVSAFTRWFGGWFTQAKALTGKSLAYRRSLITGLTIELLDAAHVRAFRLPFNRIFVIRSTPPREYDFVGQDYVAIGADYDSTSVVIGKALDELGYQEEAK